MTHTNGPPGFPGRFSARQTTLPTGRTSETIYYVQDSAYPYAEVVEEWSQEGDGAKHLAVTYAHADDLIAQTRYVSGVVKTSYVEVDGLGSTRWLTDAMGAITDSIDYDAFGVAIGRSGTTSVGHLYRGERFDLNVGLYDLRARLYDPANGRFFTQDSFAGLHSDPRSLHKYTYAHADPLNGSDPSGRVTLTELAIANEIRSELVALQIETGFDIYSRYMVGDQDAMSPIQLGFLTMLEAGADVRRFLFEDSRCAHCKLAGKRGFPLVFDFVNKGWKTPAGLFYGPDHKFGNRLLHVLDHLNPNAIKSKHTLFAMPRNDVVKALDEAWLRKKPSDKLPTTPNKNDNWVIDMGRVVGRGGETRIMIVTYPNSSDVVTAYPY